MNRCWDLLFSRPWPRFSGNTIMNYIRYIALPTKGDLLYLQEKNWKRDWFSVIPWHIAIHLDERCADSGSTFEQCWLPTFSLQQPDVLITDTDNPLLCCCWLLTCPKVSEFKSFILDKFYLDMFSYLKEKIKDLIWLSLCFKIQE